MLSAVIFTILSYPTFAAGATAGTPEVCLFRSSRTKNKILQSFNARGR